MYHDHDQIQEMFKNIYENIKYLFQIVCKSWKVE